MAITEVVVNYTARNYFNDYDETRSERMTWVEAAKGLKGDRQACKALPQQPRVRLHVLQERR